MYAAVVGVTPDLVVPKALLRMKIITVICVF